MLTKLWTFIVSIFLKKKRAKFNRALKLDIYQAAAEVIKLDSKPILPAEKIN